VRLPGLRYNTAKSTPSISDFLDGKVIFEKTDPISVIQDTDSSGTFRAAQLSASSALPLMGFADRNRQSEISSLRRESFHGQVTVCVQPRANLIKLTQGAQTLRDYPLKSN